MSFIHRVSEAVAAAIGSARQEISRFLEFLTVATAAVRDAWLATAPPAAAQLQSSQKGAPQGSAASPVAFALALADRRRSHLDGAQTCQGQGCAPPYPDG